MKKAICFSGFLFFVMVLHIQTALSQPTNYHTEPHNSDSLYNTVAKLDSLYFSAHNRCNLEIFRSLLAPDLEAYHDMGGYTEGRENFMELMSQFCSNPQKTQRMLIPGTLEVYPMENVGAIQMASHSFHRIDSDGNKESAGIAKMMVLWEQEKDNNWVVSKIFSYDHQPPPRPKSSKVITEPQTQMVSVDGHKMRVQTYGLNNKWHQDIPTIVFENGSLSPLNSWGQVPKQVSAFAPVITYDRSTIGESEWDGQLGTPAHVTENLWALLNKLNVDPFYVLVGWSWGGDLVRYHAGTHPEDIAGLVHVDPTVASPKTMLATLKSIGFDENQYEKEVANLENGLQNLPPAHQADVKPINQIYASKVEPDYGDIPNVPTAVLLSGKFHQLSPEEIKMFGEPPYDMNEHFEAKLRLKIQRTSEWALASPEGLFTVVRNSDHAIQINEPKLVTDAIHRIVFPDPTRKLHALLKEEGIAPFQTMYRNLKEYYPADRFNEGTLNSLGYQLLAKDNIKEAISVFELNIEEYPEAANPHDSLGDAYRAAGELEKAKESYKKAVAMGMEPSKMKLEQVTKRINEHENADSLNNRQY